MQQEKSFLGKLLVALLSVFIANWPKLVEKLRKKIPTPIEEKVKQVIDIVNEIKNYEPGPDSDLITEVIKGDPQDATILFLRALLDSILKGERLVEIPTSELTRGQLKTIADELLTGYAGIGFDQAVLTNQVVYSDLFGQSKASLAA